MMMAMTVATTFTGRVVVAKQKTELPCRISISSPDLAIQSRPQPPAKDQRNRTCTVCSYDLHVQTGTDLGKYDNHQLG
jgi:hypothetical protein